MNSTIGVVTDSHSSITQKEAENTVDALEDQKNSFLLERVLPENFSVSNKALTLDEQPSHRNTPNNLNCCQIMLFCA